MRCRTEARRLHRPECSRASPTRCIRCSTASQTRPCSHDKRECNIEIYRDEPSRSAVTLADGSVRNKKFTAFVFINTPRHPHAAARNQSQPAAYVVIEKHEAHHVPE